MKKAKKTALAGILSALSVVILLFGSIFETLDISVAAIASFIIMLACEELKGKYPLLIYAVVSVLSFLLLPNKYGVFMYVFFYGYYPVIKLKIESKIKHKPILLLLKFSVFTASMISAELLYLLLFAPTAETSSVKLIIITALLSEFTFFIFDIVLNRIRLMYIGVWRKHISKFL